MHAIDMLVRRAWRRHVAASILLVVVAGLAGALVGASFQAAARASTSLERFTQRSRIFDVIVQGCPPEVDPSVLSSQSDVLEQCANPKVSARLARELRTLPEVERTAGSSTLVVGLLDPTVSNRWGRLGLLEATTSSAVPIGRGHPIVVEGRIMRPSAPDEIVLSEGAARDAGVHAGATLRMAGWSQEHLDRAIDGQFRPETASFPVQVVGVVRFVDDVQSNSRSNLSDSLLEGNVYAGPGWFRAHGATFSGYGSAALARLRDGPAPAPAFRRQVRTSLPDWQTNVDTTSDVSLSAPRKVIDIQGRAVLVFGAIAAIAAVAFVGSMLVRQLRREAAEVAGLTAIGITRSQLRLVNIARSLTIALPASALAVIGVILLSPLGPSGLARQLEFDLGIRVDVPVLVLTALGVIVVVAALAASARVAGPAPWHGAARTSRLTRAAGAGGPVVEVAAVVARGRTSRGAVVMTAIAVAAGIAAAGVVSGYDALVASPSHYGAWWDVAVGQYSEAGPFHQGVEILRTNPNVIAAAGYTDDTEVATIAGRPVWLVGTTNIVGHHRPVMTSGRPPVSNEEIALGRETASDLGKHVGDEIVLRSDRGRHRRMRITGIAVVNDPITDQANAGRGAIVQQSVMATLTQSAVPQSIVVRLDPRRDRTRAIATLQRDFSGSIRAASPQIDVTNAGRLRAVPWILAGLIGLLALATLVHALVTILGRHRVTMAVVGALGFSRGQRRAVAISASAGLVALGIVAGIPVGLVIGNRLWSTVADGIGIPTDGVLPTVALVVIPAAALILAILVAVAASRRSVRIRPGQDLHVE